MAGRPKKAAAPPPRPIQPLSADELAAIAPVRQGSPDIYNYIPSRFIPLDEAQSRGWTLFYDGRACRYGHQAPRYVSNPATCVDCHRISRGKSPIGGRSNTLAVESPRGFYEARTKPTAGAVDPKPREPDPLEKRFLERYASVKDLDEAARLIGSTSAQIHMRLSTSKVFRDACNDLEGRLNIRPTVPEAADFQWDDEKRQRYITVWIDSGDPATARDAIRVTMSDFHAEFTTNAEFKAHCAEAEPIANLALEERARQLALAGNDKLLTVLLKAEKPEKYSERLNVKLNITEQLTDEQINAQLITLSAAHRKRLERSVVAEQGPAAKGVGTAQGSGSALQPEPYLDLL